MPMHLRGTDCVALTCVSRLPLPMAQVRELWEVYLRPWREYVTSGGRGVMAAHNMVNWVPMHANKPLLTDVLRHRFGLGDDGYSAYAHGHADVDGTPGWRLRQCVCAAHGAMARKALLTVDSRPVEQSAQTTRTSRASPPTFRCAGAYRSRTEPAMCPSNAPVFDGAGLRRQHVGRRCDGDQRRRRSRHARLVVSPHSGRGTGGAHPRRACRPGSGERPPQEARGASIRRCGGSFAGQGGRLPDGAQSREARSRGGLGETVHREASRMPFAVWMAVARACTCTCAGATAQS